MGGRFSSQLSFGLCSCAFFLPALLLNCFVLLPAVAYTAGAEIKVPTVEILELGNVPLKPGIGQSIAVHTSLIART